MKQKVLIIGPVFFGYNDSFKKAFENLGYDAMVFQYDGLIHPFNLGNALLNKLSPSNVWLKVRSRTRFNAESLQVFNTFQPDLVFIYNGDILDPETILRFKEKCKVAVWLLDGVDMHPDSLQLAPWVDAYFCFERTDVEKVNGTGGNAYFLPQGYDPDIYHPLAEITKRDIDVIFIGNLYHYPERVCLLKSVASRLKGNYTFIVFGTYKPLYKNPVKWLFREQRNIFQNKNVTPQEANVWYNRSKTCLNIHHWQTKEGANPKVFEICGAGAFQITDYNPFIQEVYSDGQVALYHSEKELSELILESLNQDVSVRQQEAHRIVLEKHTFTSRIVKVLEALNLRATDQTI